MRALVDGRHALTGFSAPDWLAHAQTANGHSGRPSNLPPMNRPNLSALGVWLLVTAALALALTSLVPSNAELARRAEAVLGDALGVPVTVRTLRWRLFPAPLLVIDGIATVQPQPIRFIRLTLFAGLPRSGDDWRGEVGLLRLLRIARAELDGAEVPPQSLRGLGQADAD